MLNFGFGEYEPRDKGHSQHIARSILLDRIAACAPEVLDDLRQTAYGLFIEGGLDEWNGPNLRALWNDLEYFCTTPDADKFPASFRYSTGSATAQTWQALYFEIEDWQTRHHLEPFPWIRERAFFTVSKWFFPIRNEWSYETVCFTEFNLPDLNLIIPGWEPVSTTKTQFITMARDRFAKALTDYIATAEAEVERSGEYVKTTDKNGNSHFEWLVRFQIQEWTLEKIMGDYKVNSAQTVSKGIQEAKKLLGVKSDGRSARNKSTFSPTRKS